MAWDVTLIKTLAVFFYFMIYLWTCGNSLPINSYTEDSLSNSATTEINSDINTDFTVISPYTDFLKGCITKPFDTPSCTQTTICWAQCTAKCDDSQKIIPPVLTKDNNKTDNNLTKSYCMLNCVPFQSDDWIQSCDDIDCVEECAHLNDGGFSGELFLPDPPYNLTYHQVDTAPRLLNLTWIVDTMKSRHSVLHVVETYSEEYWNTINTTSDNYYNLNVDVCDIRQFRVASVNQFGYNGYSTAITRSELPAPGSVKNITASQRPYYNVQAEGFILKFMIEPPIGWSRSDLGQLTVNNLDKKCTSTTLPPIPIVEEIYPSTADPENTIIVLFVGKTGFDCTYYSNVTVESKCGVPGKDYEFHFNLTNCDAIANYACAEVPFIPPSNVENVTTNVISNSMKVFVKWSPPSHLGSSYSISYYLIQWGEIVKIRGFPIPNLKEEDQLEVPGDKLEQKVVVEKVKVEYGIKIMAVVPYLVNESGVIKDRLDMMPIMDEFIVPEVEPVYTFSTNSLLYSSVVTVLPPSYSITPLYKDSVAPLSDENDPPSFNLIPVYIILPVIAVVLVLLGTYVFVRKKRIDHQKSERSRPLYNLNPGYNASVFKQIDTCMAPNPFYEISESGTVQSRGDRWEVERRYVTLGEILGRGAFGQVVKGSVKTAGLSNVRKISCGSYTSGVEDTRPEEITVAVKMLLPLAGDLYKVEFKKEINLMKSIGYHPNVVSIIGCITDNEPLSLIVEHVPHGDLLHYLRNHRQMMHQENNSDSGIKEESTKLTLQDLMCISRQIAVGMKGFVHRDLACRNILVGDNKLVKIGDFGLTRYIYDDKIYVTKKGGKLPLKWMAIEAIFDLTFTCASDVWSFGVVLFELVTLGGTPYPTVANRDLLRELRSGYRMEQPDNCPDTLYEVMCNCWKENPKDRPTFTQLRDFLDDLIEAHSTVDYITFNFDHDKPYYKVEQQSTTTEGDELFGIEANSGEVISDNIESQSLPDVSQCSASPNCSPSKSKKGPKEKGLKSLKVKGKDGCSMGKISMHTPLKIMRRSADDLLSVSTCSTDQLLLNSSSVSTSDPGYELHQCWLGETKL